jgi:cytoskeletal protein CcmA (bactofilin family)
MWKREEESRSAAKISVASAAKPASSIATSTGHLSGIESRIPRNNVVHIGKSVVIKGEITGSEDLMIEGKVEGKISLPQSTLTVGADGNLNAEISANMVIVFGEIKGNVTASEKVDIRDRGTVDGDIKTKNLVIADGAHFRGSIDMHWQTNTSEKQKVKPESKRSVVQPSIPRLP